MQDYDTGASRTLPIGFNFTFFCNRVDTVLMAVDGRMLFGEPDLAAVLTTAGRAWPTAYEEVAVLSTDLTTDVNATSGKLTGNHASMYYAVIGAAPKRVFVAQWSQMYVHNTEAASSSDLGAVGTFQALLYEDGNEIVLRYPELVSSAADVKVTVGVGSATAEAYYSAGSSSIPSYVGRAVRFSPVADPDGACSGKYTMTEVAAASIMLSDSLGALQLLQPSGVPDSGASVWSPSGEIVVTEDMNLSTLSFSIARGTVAADADVSDYYFRLQIFPGSGWYT